MTARKNHFDAHGEFTAICGAEPREGAAALLTTGDRDQVTCGHCLKVLADIEAERAADLIRETEAFLDSLDAQAIDSEVITLSLSMVPASGKWERDVAARHGLEEAAVSNAVAAGWLKR